ncbi:MAG: Cys-Gln thioester bond-forming surface protein [Prevotella sp.]|nr:Cys-Gln thioester bond-forming surface protein [Prevotella sp.]
MKKNLFRKGMSALLAVMMCLSAFIGMGTTTAFAAEAETDEVVMMAFPREGDDNYSANWGHGELHYMNGWFAGESKKVTVYTIGSWNGNACYCIEPGTPLAIGDVMTKRDETYWDNYPSTYNKTIEADEIKLFIGRIFQYGYTGTVTTEWRSQNAADADKLAHIMATQTLVWETIVGERDSDFNHVDPGSYDAVKDRVATNHPLYSQFISYYNSMEANVQKHSKVPSFFAKSTSKAQEIELAWNGTNYSATLTDTNNVLGNYTFSADQSGISFSVSGNKLTVTANTAPSGKVSITATKTGSVRKGVVVWSDGVITPGSGIQDLSTYSAEVNDPVKGYLNIKVSLGSAKIVKTSEDGKVSGITFTITGNGVNKTVTTGANGEIKIDNLSPGTYTVTEEVEDRYEPQTAKTVTVVSGQTTTVSFNNTLKRGDLKIVKTSEDGIVSGIPFVVSGNGITKNVTTDANGEIKIEGLLPGTYTVTEQHKDYYEPQASQTVTVEYDKTATVSFDNVLKRGDLTVTKTAEDGLTEGIKFRLTGTSDSGVKIDVTATVDSTGKAYFKDILIGSGYVLEEVDTALKYIVPDSQDVEIEWAKVATAEVYNELKRGDLKVIKTSEDNFVEGMRFHLYGTSLSGEKVSVYAYTDKNGVAVFEDILIGSNYTVEEVNTAIRYVIPESQGAVIEWNKVTEVKFHNVLKKWRADVFKIDADLAGFDDGDSGLVPVELMPMAFSLDSDAMVDDLGGIYGQAQGDATLEGAVYGVFKDGALIDTYTTDKNGYFLTDYYPCYENVEWTIREISPSEGYLLDETVYYIDTYAGQYTVELNTVYPDVYEDIIKGKITIIKHTDDGSTKIETPEVGAMFEIYLKSAGSYEAAETTERDILTCDEFGYAETIDLPYGVYLVKQIKGWDGRELLDPFEVFVSEDGEVYRYLINNANFESYLHVVKTDSTTGKTIPYAGAGFQIYAPDGSLVTMSYTYPTLTVIDTFYTNEEGTLLTPEKLPYGEGYYLVEVQAPHGYVLDATPIYFDVTEENSADENGITIVKVVKENEPQKGTITITKTGEVFSSVAEQNGVYQPVYEIKGLAGAVYEITAAEDVVTLDGTLRYKKGDVVATITTGADGTATTEPLFLGKFEIREITAPHGMILNGDTVTVELTYAGQEIKITTTSAAFVNERQKVEIDLSKVLEQDEKYGIGRNNEITSVKFGLYASEDITAADGKVIPKDGLIEAVTCDENGKAVFVTDLPVGAKVYVKEIATDSHYILSDSTYPVTFEYAGQDTAVVKISVNDGEAITNEIIRGTIIGKKLDEDGFTICGALFGLFRENETEFTEETALATCQSNEIGIFTFENVPFGRWIVREIKAAPAFVLNENSYAVTVGTDEEVIEITIENEFITGSVKTTKVDKEYPDNKLSGAVFEVYVDVDNNGEFNPEIDLFVGEMTETEDGIYEMHDLRYNGYFLHEKAAPEGFLKDDGYHYFEIRNDGETVIVENEAGVGFTNQPILGNVTTTKVDKEYPDNKLSGAVFEIYKDVDGNGEFDAEIDTLVGEMTETEAGVYLYEKLRYGGYFLYEKTAPEGFVKDDTYHYFEIRNDGETVTVENEAGVGFTNKPIVGELELTKTDISDGKVLANVGFLIRNEAGEIVAEGYTDENGIAKFTLRYGKYTYEEFAALDGYIPDTKAYPFEIKEDGEIVKAAMTNERIPEVPQTGDESNIGFWIGLAAVALGGVIATAIVLIKKKKDDENE